MTTDPMFERIGKYLTVEELGGKAKTKVWIVLGSDNSPLGQIRWYGAWRQYTFWPIGTGTVLNATCLDDIAKFTRKHTGEHMAGLPPRDGHA
jgi:hypothetical protein